MTLRRRALLLSACLFIAAVAVAADDAKDKLTTEEQTILDLTNKERAAAKLPPLKLNPALTAAARGHSANMARQNKLDHTLDNKIVVQRVEAAGYKWAWLGENIAQSLNEGPEITMQRWMESKDHKENILKDKFTEIGIGMAKSEKGDLYYTQVFATPKKK